MRISFSTASALALVAITGMALAQDFNPGDKASIRNKFTVGQPVPPPGPPGTRLKGIPDPFREEDNWAKAPPGRTWGADAGVIVDNDGKSVWFFERCDSRNGKACMTPEGAKLDPIWKYDTNGKFIKMIGKGLFRQPHGLSMDKDGNLWVADTAGTVTKLSTDGKVLLTLGKRGVKGNGIDHDTLRAPSGAAVAANGDIFVADGHDGTGPNRIVKFDKNGKFLMQWGSLGTGDDQFRTAHGICLDNEGRVYITDRLNRAVKVFTQDGKPLHNWSQFGQANGCFVTKQDIIYVADNNYQPIPEFNVSGIRIAHVSDGKLIANIPYGETNTMEGVAVDKDGIVYGAFTNMPGSHRWIPTGPLK